MQEEADMKGSGKEGAHGDRPVARKNYLCRHHARGECMRGLLCTWAHSKEQIGQVVVDYKQLGAKLDLCRHFLAGACWAGADCAWAHSEKEQMAPMVYKKMEKIIQWQGRFFQQDKTRWSGWLECEAPFASPPPAEGRTAGENARSSTDHAGGEWQECQKFYRECQEFQQNMAEMHKGEESARRIKWRQRHLNEEAHEMEFLQLQEDGAAAQCPGHAVGEEGPAQPPEEDEDEDEKSADDGELVIYPGRCLGEEGAALPPEEDEHETPAEGEEAQPDMDCKGGRNKMPNVWKV